jgi:ParB-like nuclease family protein
MDSRRSRRRSGLSVHPDGLVAVTGQGRSPVTGELVDIEALRPADSPRLAGEDPEHVRTLAETDTTLPPILVDRRTMRVVDGMHRLLAMTQRGALQIEVQFFDGSTDAAFLAAVRENVSHGLPLSRRDRDAAASRIIDSFPNLSDRAIASVCGMSHRTVAAIRNRAGGQRASGQENQLHARAGLDGRVRPVDIAAGRRVAEKIIRARPDASLREVARAAGVSPNTVRDVRERMRRGEDSVPVRHRRAEQSARTRGGEANRSDSATEYADIDVRDVLLNLRRDPSIRFNDAGRRFLHWLDVHAANFDDWSNLVEVIPAYHADSAAALARRCASVWEAIADRLDNRPASFESGPSIAQ